MPSWKLTLEYHGAQFCGWQRQPGLLSVQEAVEDALMRLHGGERVVAGAAGRTDAGVHAKGQVVSIHPERSLKSYVYLAGMNSLLPPGVAVRQVIEVPAEFCARRWAWGRRYTYRVLNSQQRSPLRSDRSWHIRQPLDLLAMQQGAKHLLGEHEFDAFRASGCQAVSTRKKLWQASIRREDDELVFCFEGNGFLRHMVRNMVGTLVDVGRGRHSPDFIQALLWSKDRTQAGRCAEPQGLCLEEVFYQMHLGAPKGRSLADFRIQERQVSG